MQVAITFPQNEVGYDVGGLRDFVQAADELGFSHIRQGEHNLGAHPVGYSGRQGAYSVDFLFHEPLVFFSYVAAITTRLGFVSGVMVLPQRQTVLVAKQAAELDFLSGGRLRLGVGVGWQDMEYSALNENFHNRGNRIVEQFEVMRALWTQETVNFEGKWHRIRNAGINPLPVQRPIPLWMGGRAEPVLKRAARIAAGWIAAWEPGEAQEPEGMRPHLERVRNYAREYGRDLSTFGFQGTMRLSRGGPDDWARVLEGWRALDATTVLAGAAGLKGSVDDHINLMRRFKEAARW